jgi:hypothetical protein
MAGPIWPDRPHSPDLGPTTHLAAMLAEDVLRAHRHLLTAAPSEGLGPWPEQPRRPALLPAFPQLLRKTSSSTSPSLPPSSTWRGPLPPPGRAARAARGREIEASPRFLGVWRAPSIDIFFRSFVRLSFIFTCMLGEPSKQ